MDGEVSFNFKKYKPRLNLIKTVTNELCSSCDGCG